MTKLTPEILERSQHPISRSNISKNALKVLYKLKESGYEGHLVGGSVRDLLLGQHPKDFDIVTNAKPDEIKKLFRNCRLIGRRFRLAHIVFGDEIIEVATFRGMAKTHGHQVHENGRILRDNVFGTIEEDVFRRDFTINALYYNIENFSIIDYVQGAKDIEHKLLRLIGDPDIRYREDPVRMLRAIRFASKLDFQIETDSKNPIQTLSHYLKEVPPARLYDETLKIINGKNILKNIQLLQEYNLLHYLFPVLPENLTEEFLTLLHYMDLHFNEFPETDPSLFFAALLWPIIRNYSLYLQKNHEVNFHDALQAATGHILLQQNQSISMPKFIYSNIRQINSLQARIQAPKLKIRQIQSIQSHPQFIQALHLLKWRVELGEMTEEEYKKWENFTPEVEGEDKPKRKRVRYKKKKPKT